jgi:hypothetical protein
VEYLAGLLSRAVSDCLGGHCVHFARMGKQSVVFGPDWHARLVAGPLSGTFRGTVVAVQSGGKRSTASVELGWFRLPGLQMPCDDLRGIGWREDLSQEIPPALARRVYAAGGEPAHGNVPGVKGTGWPLADRAQERRRAIGCPMRVAGDLCP